MKLKTISLAIIFAFVAAALFVSVTNAQSFIGGGASFNRTSAYDPSPAQTGDGGQNFFGAYVEAGSRLPLNLEMRVLGEYGFKASLPTIFTRDEGSARRAVGEFRLRPELRFNFSNTGPARPFIFGGGEYFRQRFEGEEAEGYGRGAPASGFNPIAGFGVGLGGHSEASFARLFPDNTVLNNSRLEGYRFNYTFKKKLGGRLALKIGGEADYLTFREASGFELGDYDDYRERDFLLRVRVGFVFADGK